MPGAEAAPLPAHCAAPWQGGPVLPPTEPLQSPDPKLLPVLMAPWHPLPAKQHQKVCCFFAYPNIFNAINRETSYEYLLSPQLAALSPLTVALSGTFPKAALVSRDNLLKHPQTPKAVFSAFHCGRSSSTPVSFCPFTTEETSCGSAEW